MKKVVTVLIAGCLVLAFALSGCTDAEREEAIVSLNDAIGAYNNAVDDAKNRNAELEEAIQSADKVVTSGDLPLDPVTLTDCETFVTESRAALQEIPEAPQAIEEEKASKEEIIEKTDEYRDATKTLDAIPDYATEIAGLEEAQAALESSIKQREQVTNPSESFVVERLEGIETIVGVSAVTEDNDPNGQLNKQGGYTASVYFTSSEVDQSSVTGETIIDKGTNGGGCIEVYTTAEEAEARNTYLAAYDGSILASGSHQVIGTVVVRTSNNLTATQQTDLTALIVSNLTELR